MRPPCRALASIGIHGAAWPPAGKRQSGQPQCQPAQCWHQKRVQQAHLHLRRQPVVRAEVEQHLVHHMSDRTHQRSRTARQRRRQRRPAPPARSRRRAPGRAGWREHGRSKSRRCGVRATAPPDRRRPGAAAENAKIAAAPDGGERFVCPRLSADRSGQPLENRQCAKQPNPCPRMRRRRCGSAVRGISYSQFMGRTGRHGNWIPEEKGINDVNVRANDARAWRKARPVPRG